MFEQHHHFLCNLGRRNEPRGDCSQCEHHDRHNPIGALWSINYMGDLIFPKLWKNWVGYRSKKSVLPWLKSQGNDLHSI